MITNCKFTCITVESEFFSKAEIFYTHILWPIPYSLVNGLRFTVRIFRTQQRAYQLFFSHFRVRIGLPFFVLPDVLGSKLSS